VSSTNNATALLLVNMGGPANPDEVQPYLRAIFRDPAILPLPAVLRLPLGRWIARRRAPKSARRYALIGGRSPLLDWTQRQAAALRQALGREGAELEVAHAFRYSAPLIGEALRELGGRGIERVVLLPLFPHHAEAMTGSVRREAERKARSLGLEIAAVPAWGNRPEVLELWQAKLSAALQKARGRAHVLFVAHGIPERNVRRGEDYPDRVLESASGLGAKLPEQVSWSLAYQSRVGPVAWTRPYLDDEIERVASRCEALVLVPLSFVAECLETLYDLDMVATEQAQAAGIAEVIRVPAFNDDRGFARALARMALERLEEGDHG